MLKEDEKCSTDIDEKLGTKERKKEMKGLKKTDFESSKRKFEEQSAEQKEAKRRICYTGRIHKCLLDRDFMARSFKPTECQINFSIFLCQEAKEIWKAKRKV
ncbi:hypothetical protein H5410_012845 [Solanum commersonii]|uniref:Uncharacterized protein n=1 Tax=Solanum commersonii TaxID=4109 RepID=A0A9J6ATK6_SOLCO|nr:hypothetical protein H5410_012845 [Solanum commersonii]